MIELLKSLPENQYANGYIDGNEVAYIDISVPYTTNLSDKDFKANIDASLENENGSLYKAIHKK